MLKFLSIIYKGLIFSKDLISGSSFILFVGFLCSIEIKSYLVSSSISDKQDLLFDPGPYRTFDS